MKSFYFGTSVRSVGCIAALVAILAVGAPQALASASKDKITSRASAPASSTSQLYVTDQASKWSLGFTSVSYALASGTNLVPSAFAALLEMSGGNALQFSFSIPGTSPFQMMFGAQYKHTLKSSRGAGFHIGGGLGLGLARVTAASNGFALVINPLVGLHSPLYEGSPVSIHVDGGPAFVLVDGNTDFGVGAGSALLGLTFLYAL